MLLSISCFVLCYELSGVLAQAAVASGAPREIGQLDVPLLVNAAAIFLIFERSWGGLFMMVLLATIGPAVETQLIGALHLYAYSDPDVAGIPTWIAWVYAAGGPPNGALGRQILHELNLREQMKSRIDNGLVNLRRDSALGATSSSPRFVPLTAEKASANSRSALAWHGSVSAQKQPRRLNRSARTASRNARATSSRQVRDAAALALLQAAVRVAAVGEPTRLLRQQRDPRSVVASGAARASMYRQ